ncbi:MAG: hypothetical protein GXY86_15985 [Firmicutes bacterium]|nr:hypothetical protein [Bacillota bacterium]
MSLLATIGFSFFILGILLIVKSKTNRNLLWAAIPILLAGALSVIFVVNNDVDTNLIGMEILKDTPQEFLVELHYFPTKDQAFTFYSQKKVEQFMLLAKFGGSAADLFKMINVNPTADGGKKMAFFENPARLESAQEVFQHFYMTNNLFTIYNSVKSQEE